MTRRSTTALASTALGLLLLACSPGSASPSPSDSGSPFGAWVLQAGRGPTGPIPLVDGRRITLQVDANQVGGTSACNSYGGTIRLAGNQLRIGQIGGTEMACEPDVMASEAAFVQALPTVTHWVRDGDRLILGGPETELTFVLLAPVPTAEIVDTVWVLDTLISGEVAASVEGGPTLELHADGTLSGSTGCRELTGRYITTGDQIQVTDLAADGDCPDALVAQDHQVTSVLEGPMVADVTGNQLTLQAPGNIGLAFTALPE